MKPSIAAATALAIMSAAAWPCAADVAEEARRYVETLRRDVKDPGELPARIVAAAKALDTNADLRAALYERAYEEGIRTPKGHPAAAEALEALLELAPAQAGRWRQALLKLHQLRFARAGGVDKARAAAALIDVLIALGDDDLAAGRGAEAGVLYARARTLAARYGSHRKGEIARKLKAAGEARGVQQEMRRCRERLERNEDDLEARTKLIRLYVVELDRPDEAQKLLNPRVDETWRTYVPLARKPPADLAGASCLEMGNWYWGHWKQAGALGGPRMLDRAAAYYKRFLATHSKKDVASLTASRRLDELEKVRARRERSQFGAVGSAIAEVHTVGHSCQVWRVLPAYALGTRYRVSIRHAAAGAAGAFHIIAFADTDGNGTPDKRIGMSPLCRASWAGQWTAWEFTTKRKAVFVGNCWRAPPHIYYATRRPAGYVGLSDEMYVGRAVGKTPTEAVKSRYTNIKVDVIE